MQNSVRMDSALQDSMLFFFQTHLWPNRWTFHIFYFNNSRFSFSFFNAALYPIFTGLDNALLCMDKTMMVFGDAKKVVEDMLKSVS